MDFDLSEEQQVLVTAIQSACRPYQQPTQDQRFAYSYFVPELQRKLEADGFIDGLRSGLTPLDVALMILEAGSLPCVVDLSASALVAPLVSPDQPIQGPVALLSDRLGDAHRNLAIARHAIARDGDEAVVLAVSQDNVEPARTVLAYPYGRFKTLPDLAGGRRLGPGSAALLEQWWRVGLSLEMAAAAMTATDFTVDYVKQRHVFGKPVGMFQAIQHRLAQCHQIAKAMKHLALKAAFTGAPNDALLAATYCQAHVHKFAFDLHQFNGGMGVTNEHLLHLWTYRMRGLQTEVGGSNAAALAFAEARWPISKAGAPAKPPGLVDA